MRITTYNVTYKADWLFINYFAADNNLAAAELDNFAAMQRVGSTDSVAIVSFIDISAKTEAAYLGSSDWKDQVGFDGARLYYMTQSDKDYTIDSRLVKDYGSCDSGRKETLQAAISDALIACPAEKVALFLNDHGGSVAGVCQDYTFDSILTISDVKAAIGEATANKGVDILAFDACLMANLEVAYELRGSSQWIVASAENVGWNGFNYNTTEYGSIFGKALGTVSASSSVRELPLADSIATLQQKSSALCGSKVVTPEMDAASVAKLMVSANQRVSNTVHICAAIDCGKIETVATALDAFGTALSVASDKAKFGEAITVADSYYTISLRPELASVYRNSYCTFGAFYAGYARVFDGGNTVASVDSAGCCAYDLHVVMDTIYDDSSCSYASSATGVLQALESMFPASGGYYYGAGWQEYVSINGEYQYCIMKNYSDNYGLSAHLPTKAHLLSARESSVFPLESSYKSLEFYRDHGVIYDTIRSIE